MTHEMAANRDDYLLNRSYAASARYSSSRNHLQWLMPLRKVESPALPLDDSS